MTNLLDWGATWLAEKTNDHAGTTVRYERGGATLIEELTGVVSMHEYQVIESDTSMTTVTAFDWVFTTSDLVFGGESIKPRSGDVIVATVDGCERRYEPLPLGVKPVAEDADPSAISTLIHTKRVG